MICDLCKQDRPQHRMRTLVIPRLGWPPLRLVAACRDCRHFLKGSAVYRTLAYLFYLTLFAAVAAAGYGLVWLTLWIIRRASTS